MTSAGTSATCPSSCRPAAVRLTDGNEDGVRAIDVRVQGGLRALVLADRGHGHRARLGRRATAQLAEHDRDRRVRPTSTRGAGCAPSTAACSSRAGSRTSGPEQRRGRPPRRPRARLPHPGARRDRTGSRTTAGSSPRCRARSARPTSTGPTCVLHRTLRFPMGEPAGRDPRRGREPGLRAGRPDAPLPRELGYPVVARGREAARADARRSCRATSRERRCSPSTPTSRRRRRRLRADSSTSTGCADPRRRSATIGIVNPAHTPDRRHRPVA